MASVKQMKDPLLVGKAIRAQLEQEIPQDLPLEKDFREGTDYTITDQYVFFQDGPIFFKLENMTVSMYYTRNSARTLAHSRSSPPS